MKLKVLYERRRKAESVRFFHGTDTKESLYSILSNGLYPHAWASGERGKIPSKERDSSLVYLARDLSLALFYGNYIIEIIVNLSDTSIIQDDDTLPIGEVTDEVKDVENLFNKWMPFVSKADRRRFKLLITNLKNRYGYVDHNNEQLRAEFRRLATKYRKHMPIERDALRRGESVGQHLNIALPRKIGLRGRTRIVGAYHFRPPSKQELSAYHRKEAPKLYVCDKVYYNNGGSIELGDKSRAAMDWME